MAVYATWDYINIQKRKDETDDNLFMLIESEGLVMMIGAWLATFVTFLTLIGAVESPSKDNHKPPTSIQY